MVLHLTTWGASADNNVIGAHRKTTTAQAESNMVKFLITIKRTVAILSVVFCLGVKAQEPETYLLHQAVSNRETIVYTRVIRYDGQKHLSHVQDFFENGRIQMDAFYSSFDKRVKEGYQCNYRSNTKEGPYTEWYRNGQKRFEGRRLLG